MWNQSLQTNSTVPKSTDITHINMKSPHSGLMPLLVIAVLVSGIVSLTSVYADEDLYKEFEQFEDQSREKFEQIHEEFEDERWALEDSFNEKRMALEDEINQQYRELEDQLNEERWEIEDEFHEKRISLQDDIDRQFRELDSELQDSWNDFNYNIDDELDYDFAKQQIEDEHYEKRVAIEDGMYGEWMQFDESYQDAMSELENSFEKDRRALDESSRDMYRNLEDSFQKEFRYLDEEFNDEQRKLENETRDERRSMEKEYREQRMEQEYDRYDDYGNDDDFMKIVPPEDYDSIEKIKNTIMAEFSMEELESYWANGDMEGLLSEILSRTDLTRAEVEKIFGYAAKYDDRYMDEYEPKHQENNYEFDRLEQRIQELEDENRELRGYISDLEKKLENLNEIVMEQLKVIYDWIIVR